MDDRPQILCISGFDSSGGAGILADTRAVEARGGQPLGVLTGITMQNHTQLVEMRWHDWSQIGSSLEALASEPVRGVKIGAVPDAEILCHLIERCLQYWGDVPIVWDPVFSSSSGYRFWSGDGTGVQKCVDHITLLTPNIVEWDEMQSWNIVPLSTAVLVKGGHQPGKDVTDTLYLADGSYLQWSRPRINTEEKRGTGCVLSSAIATDLARGQSISDAIVGSLDYIRYFIGSTSDNTGKYFGHEAH